MTHAVRPSTRFASVCHACSSTMVVAVVAPALYCLILVLRGGLDRSGGVLLAALLVAYVAAALRGEFGMAG